MVNKSVFLALDTDNLNQAFEWVNGVKFALAGIKVGLELFTSHGINGIWALADLELPIFLDLKLHDIPNTVARTVAVLNRLPVGYITVHATGGGEMIRAAKESTGAQVLAVTPLTSLAIESNVVADWAQMAQAQGADGVVCSGTDIRAVRRACGNNFTIFVPAIRWPDEKVHDQRRVIAPHEALRYGADYLVVGRSWTASQNPCLAAQLWLDRLENANPFDILAD